ncbi:hypothetical protein D6T69_13295 [Tenacibaculum singaporense]|uniref:Uncharacterized protein n=1 Tax=Tenacibaculum singaporense TaxID=2358479 RepID=A0A3Q8RT80_9FLAO|nr:hypothetical protein [Tenacibaculum singaporense]AZJ36443.1 hypothetical protein D6T69_13295 [Tenacibaculum singaporense]
MKKKKHYSPEELDFKNGSEGEQIRTRKIFEELRQRAINGENLLEREKEFLCLGLSLSLKDDGKPQNFDFCDDFIFRELYLTYFHNNLEGPFYKARKGKIVEVSLNEQTKDFKTLQKVINGWSKGIEIINHTDQILQEIAAETRRELKDLEKKFPRLSRNFKKVKKAYELQKDKIILQSKYIYHLTKSVMEDYDKSEFQIPFSGQTIELTIYSFVHIINRHYAAKIKDKPEKTYHHKNFYPKELHIDLKNILIEIDKLKKINIDNTDNIIFSFDNVVYQIWVQTRIKQVKGEGNVNFKRVQSFYPIYDKEKLKEINSNYELIKISDKLEVYIKK